jgi:hypothetical protein
MCGPRASEKGKKDVFLKKKRKKKKEKKKRKERKKLS